MLTFSLLPKQTKHRTLLDKHYSDIFIIKLKYFKRPATKLEYFSRIQWRPPSQIYALVALHRYKTWKLKNLTQPALLAFSESHLPCVHKATDNNLQLPTGSPAVFLR